MHRVLQQNQRNDPTPGSPDTMPRKLKLYLQIIWSRAEVAVFYAPPTHWLSAGDLIILGWTLPGAGWSPLKFGQRPDVSHSGGWAGAGLRVGAEQVSLLNGLWPVSPHITAVSPQWARSRLPIT